uniref:Tetratricopeptide repeat protein n=1 Tax=Ignavibacterium album TaxID=591197 RepID=A0A832CXU2_9BACT
MSNFQEIRNRAQELRKQKKYSEALPLYKDLWENCEPKDKWDGWGFALCLNSLKDYKTAYKVSKRVYEIDPSFDYNKGQFAWSSYMANVKDYPDDNSTDTLENYVSEIIKITEGKEHELFRNQAILKVMDHLSNKNSWGRVIEWSNFINPEFLDTKPFDAVTSDGKKFRKPSDKESYYLKLSKALERLEKFQECIDICDNALKSFPDEIWFKWHKGSCLRKLKQFNESIKLLEEIKKLKKDWFILKELSAAYYGNKDYENAYKNFIESAVIQIRIPESQNRWELFYIGAMILYKMNNIQVADKHVALCYKLRDENQWKIPDFIQRDINTRKISLTKSSAELFNELKDFWIREQQNFLPKQIGSIKNFIQDGKAGFIKGDNGKDYYFRVNNFLGNNSSLKLNIKVQFNIQKSFDKKKNREAEEAINIILIKN